MSNGTMFSPTDPALSVMDIDLGASGLAAVWSRENTRESLWDSFYRKEVYATTGSRIILRFFEGVPESIQDRAYSSPIWLPVTIFLSR